MCCGVGMSRPMLHTTPPHVRSTPLPPAMEQLTTALNAGDVDRALVRTPIGTHCCFYEGRTLRPRSSWAHEASLEFFESVLNDG